MPHVTGREQMENRARERWDRETWQGRMSLIDYDGDRRLLQEFLDYLAQRIKNNCAKVNESEAARHLVYRWIGLQRDRFVQRWVEQFELDHPDVCD